MSVLKRELAYKEMMSHAACLHAQIKRPTYNPISWFMLYEGYLRPSKQGKLGSKLGDLENIPICEAGTGLAF